MTGTSTAGAGSARVRFAPVTKSFGFGGPLGHGVVGHGVGWGVDGWGGVEALGEAVFGGEGFGVFFGHDPAAAVSGEDLGEFGAEEEDPAGVVHPQQDGDEG